MVKARKIAAVGRECVACGSCENICPQGAIRVWNGLIARVDGEKCVGCGMCGKICPAAVIEIRERGEG